MKPNLQFTGLAGYRRGLSRIARKMEREVPSILAQEARGLAAEYGSATMPGPGFDESRIAKFAARIEADIRRVFASAGSPSAVYQRLKLVAPELAAAYWRQIKMEKPRAAAAILRKGGMTPQAADAGLHRAARTDRRARVPKAQQPEGIVPEAQLRTYVRGRMRNAGFAKAAWYGAAAALGGRVRRTVEIGDGKRRSEQIFPASLRKIARANPHIGGAFTAGRGLTSRVTVFSNVTHADSAIPPRLEIYARARAADRLRSAIAKVLSKVTRTRSRAA
jgi:hypothetical protein